ncbi:MAG: hypothetical protein JW762_06055 [Dehalococcoidales bacterium]|nr:hypothetical protein [Dehalococcoidales bacterium]
MAATDSYEPDLAFKLDHQANLAIKNNQGITISIQYILLYPEIHSMSPRSRVRLDIRNESDNTLKWTLPIPKTTNSFIKDASGKAMFLPQSGCGVLAEKGEGFDVNANEGNYVLTAKPDSKGSVFLYFDTIPETVEKIDIMLDGFYFNEKGESWDISFKDIPFTYEIAPFQAGSN